MKKIAAEFVKDQYRSGVENYSAFTTEVGLWDSEKYVFQKYLKSTDSILDLGCGTGRTTFHLHQLGYQDIIGVDLTPEMIDRAQELNHHFKTHIDFREGDALNLEFAEETFQAAVFSFNGLMSIPDQKNRNKALMEINRVLTDSGTFIFTTHDREVAPEFFEFWKEEEQRWKSGNQDPLLFEFGDVVASSKNESRDIFIHIPNQNEVQNFLVSHCFELIETFYRSEKFEESPAVKAKSGECRFWIAQKKGSDLTRGSG